ncbi:MAG TPA: YraN family protein [Nitrospiria bacterium]|nr:YraN family protein [Nitrospiria bacterium]
MSLQRIIGMDGEIAALDYLRRVGYRILVHNYRSPPGEIDIVAEDGNSLVFIEVKTRSTSRFGTPQEAVDRKKQSKIARAALYYLSEHQIKRKDCRFDVVVVSVGSEPPRKIELMKNAFDFPV